MPTIKLRHGTAEQWVSANPILLGGEPGFETDSGKYKIGNGGSRWSELPYYPAPSSNGNYPDATETNAGVAKIASSDDTYLSLDDSKFVTPLKLLQKLEVWAQPLSSRLTALSNAATGAFGLTLLGSATAAQAKTSLQLAAVATSGSASDITTGTLPTSVLPPLAINDVFVVASQTAMLALSAQRGDVAIRTDTSTTYILSADAPGTLANWVQVLAGTGGGGAVTTVAGRTGNVVLTSADVGLGNANNTSDANKPVSGPQQTALNLKRDSKNAANVNLTSNTDNIGQYTIVDDGTASSGWPNRLAYFFQAAGEAAGGHLTSWFNEYGEFRVGPGKNNTVPFRVYGGMTIADTTARSMTDALIEVDDNRVNRNVMFAVFPNGNVSAAGNVTAPNVAQKVRCVPTGTTGFGTEPDGTLWVEYTP